MIAFDAKNSILSNFSSHIFYTHTVVGTSNLAAIVLVTVDSAVNTITFGGTTPTLITTATDGSTNMSLYYITGISTGANTVDLTSTAGGRVSLASVSYTGVAQGGQIVDVIEKTSQTGTTQSVAGTSIYSGEVFFGVVFGSDSHVFTTSAGQTERFNFEITATGVWQAAGDFSQGFGAKTFNWTTAGSSATRATLVSLREAGSSQYTSTMGPQTTVRTYVTIQMV